MNADRYLSLLQALGWALAHSLWQITVFALILAFLLPRLHGAQKRYWSALTALFLSFGVFLGTFLWIFLEKSGQQATATFPEAPLRISLNGGGLPVLSTAGFAEIMRHWLEENATWVVGLWIAGFCVSLFRLFGGMYYLHRLQKKYARPASTFWQDKVDTMRRQLGHFQPVTLLESAQVRSPLVWGYFKPLIFFPIGLLNQLSVAEVESILAHELAHIARRDWLFNLVQAFIESCFYFHPAMWWISSIVCAERENCCDDKAVQLTRDRFGLAKALLHLQQLNVRDGHSALALNAQGRRKLFQRFSLLTRIQRILNQPSQQKSLIMEKIVATALLLGVLTLIGFRANGHSNLIAANKAWPETAFAWFGFQPETVAVADSVPKPPHRIQKIIREDGGKRVEMEINDGKMTRLNIDGREVPSNEWTQHQALTDDVIREMETRPIPPAPPVPGMPPTPPMPPMGKMPPMPPPPPMPPTQRLSTSKDANGNTIIHLDRDGTPMEITIKDGEVWIGDQHVEAGEAVELPEIADRGSVVSIDEHGNYIIHSRSGDNENMTIYGPGDFPQGQVFVSPDVQMQIDLARSLAEQNHALSEKEQKKQEKAFKKAEKELRKAEKEMEKQQRNMEEQQRRMEEAQSAQRRSYHRSQE